MGPPNRAYHDDVPSDVSSQDISKDYETPEPQAIGSFSALKDRIRHHYEICSEYYLSLWYVLGESHTFDVSTTIR